MDWHAWIAQHTPFTEIQRGGATVRPAGGKGLIGDSLGPIMHIHDNASEIFYFISGRCRLEIANSEEIFGPGDFVLVPPEVPHNLWNAGDDDLLVFWLVAPNVVTNKWRTDNFPPGAMDRRAVRGRVEQGTQPPSDTNICTRNIYLSAGTLHAGHTAERQEAVIYLIEGQADVKVGKLVGTLAANDFIHVPVDTDYAVESVGDPAGFLVFEMPGGQG